MIWVSCALFGCAEEPPPPSVDEFMRNSILLEATMVRCGQNRSSTKYDAECVNAREAINRIARAEEAERRVELEEQSERKRRALRRTQEAAAEARRRAAEAEQRRREAAYLSQFGSPQPGDAEGQPSTVPVQDGTAALPPAAEDTAPVAPVQDALPPPEEQAAEPEQAPPSDIGSIREELKRRQESNQ